MVLVWKRVISTVVIITFGVSDEIINVIHHVTHCVVVEEEC